MNAPAYFFSAGEVSGDLYGAELLKALRAQAGSEFRALGLGGPCLRAAGLQILADVRPLSAVGLSENLASLPYFARLLRRLERWLQQMRPQAVILIDFQGLNLPLAARAKALNIPVYYLMAPQDWIWGLPKGPKRIAQNVSTLFSVFPQEGDFYVQAGLSVQRIGHPLLDMLPQYSRAEARQRLPLPPEFKDKTLICWMPGSRKSELKRLLPVLRKVQQGLPPDYGHLMPIAADFAQPQLQALPAHHIPLSERYLAMLAADAVIGASGNMVLEAALLARPVLALYQLSALSYTVARRLVRRPWITLPNLLLERTVVPEFVQHLAPDAIRQQLQIELTRPQVWTELAQELRTWLGPPGAMQRAAQHIHQAHSALLFEAETH